MIVGKEKRNPISYSIWFMPGHNVYDILNTLIIDIAKKYTNITFKPHVTLLGSFLGQENDLKEKSKKIAKEISPFIINFGEITYLDEFFRCLFIKIKTDHIFNNARSIAVNNFSFNDINFIPHLSLAYGLLDKMSKKEIKYFIKNNLNRVNCFYVDTLYLVKNDEINFQWTIIKEYKLNL